MLSARGISFEYRDGPPVLRDVSLDLIPGTVTVVLGPNGAGKSTLMRLMLGAIDATSGSVRLVESEVRGLDPAYLARRIGYVPQRGGSEFAFSVREVLELGRSAGGGHASLDRVVEELDLGGLLTRPVCDLSEGQRQRVTLGRALAQLRASAAPMEQRVLLADEPFSAMDPSHERSARRAMSALAADGAAVCIVMHDLRRAPRIGSRGLLLRGDGSVQACGAVEAALTAAHLDAVFGAIEE